MTHAKRMLDAYPAEITLDRDRLASVIDTLNACAQTCTACADACLSESPEMLPRLTRCIRDNMDCADICQTTVRVLSRHTGYDANLTRAQVQAAAQATKTCGDSCAEHTQMHEHCAICAETCRQAEQALNELLPMLQPTGAAPEQPSKAAPQMS